MKIFKLSLFSKFGRRPTGTIWNWLSFKLKLISTWIEIVDSTLILQIWLGEKEFCEHYNETRTTQCFMLLWVTRIGYQLTYTLFIICVSRRFSANEWHPLLDGSPLTFISPKLWIVPYMHFVRKWNESVNLWLLVWRMEYWVMTNEYWALSMMCKDRNVQRHSHFSISNSTKIKRRFRELWKKKM